MASRGRCACLATYARPKRVRATHKQAVEGVRRLIKSLGGAAYLTHQSGRVRGAPGIPDVVGCFVPIHRLPTESRMRFKIALGPIGHRRHYITDIRFAVEVKIGRDKLSHAQADYIQRAAMAEPCGIVIVGTALTVAQWLGLEV